MNAQRQNVLLIILVSVVVVTVPSLVKVAIVVKKYKKDYNHELEKRLETEEKMSNLEKAHSRLEEEFSHLRADFKRVQQERDTLKAKVGEVQQEIRALEDNLKRAR